MPKAAALGCCHQSAVAIVLAIALAGAPVGTLAAEPAREPVSTADQRAAVQARFEEAERACQSRFLVTPCVDTARQQQRKELARLQRLQSAQEESQRKAAAEKRLRRIADRRQAQERREVEAPLAASAEPVRSARTDESALPKPHPTTRALPGSAGSRVIDEARNKAKFNARVTSIDAHRAAVEMRNAERVSKGKKIAPLPAGGASSVR